MSKRMDNTHPRWEEFLERLAGPEGCDFQLTGTWKCDGGSYKSLASAILADMGDIDIPASMDWFEANGGFCDCEILFNCVE